MEIILGAGASLLVEWLKTKMNISEYKTLGILLVIALIASALYTFFVYAGYWQTVSSILVTAGAFYTFIIARFKS